MGERGMNNMVKKVLEDVKKVFSDLLVEGLDGQIILQLENGICVKMGESSYAGMWMGHLFFTPNQDLSQMKPLVSLPNGGRYEHGKIQGSSLGGVKSYIQYLGNITQPPNLAKDEAHYFYPIPSKLAEFVKKELSLTVYDEFVNIDGKYEVIVTNNQFAIRIISYNSNTDILHVFVCKISNGTFSPFAEYSHLKDSDLYGIENHIQILDRLTN